MNLRVLHVTPSFYPAIRYGGPIVSLLGLCRAELAAGLDVEVLTTNANGRENLSASSPDLIRHEEMPVHYFPRITRHDFAFSPALAQYLRENVRRFDVVHVSGVFSYASTVGGLTAHEQGVPYVVAPNGALQRWGFGRRAWKKLPYWYLWARRCLRSARAIRATTRLEAGDIGTLVPGVEVFVEPHGVPPAEPPELVERKPDQIVFLGRIHAVKGFDVMVPALSEVARARPNVELVLAGPDNDGHLAEVMALVQRASPQPRVRYVGEVKGAAKARLLAESTVLVLTSHTESFGNVVVEAMNVGTPVVATQSCPWDHLEPRGAGRWVPRRPEAVASALLEILGDASLASRMGAAGRKLAAEYRWEVIGRSMADRYRRLVGTTPAERVTA